MRPTPKGPGRLARLAIAATGLLGLVCCGSGSPATPAASPTPLPRAFVRVREIGPYTGQGTNATLRAFEAVEPDGRLTPVASDPLAGLTSPSSIATRPAR